MSELLTLRYIFHSQNYLNSASLPRQHTHDTGNIHRNAVNHFAPKLFQCCHMSAINQQMPQNAITNHETHQSADDFSLFSFFHSLCSRERLRHIRTHSYSLARQKFTSGWTIVRLWYAYISHKKDSRQKMVDGCSIYVGKSRV